MPDGDCGGAGCGGNVRTDTLGNGGAELAAVSFEWDAHAPIANRSARGPSHRRQAAPDHHVLIEDDPPFFRRSASSGVDDCLTTSTADSRFPGQRTGENRFPIRKSLRLPVKPDGNVSLHSHRSLCPTWSCGRAKAPSA
jgi:hypothetical protein